MHTVEVKYVVFIFLSNTIHVSPVRRLVKCGLRVCQTHARSDETPHWTPVIYIEV